MGLKIIVPYTTRPRRKNEKDGVDYNFIETKEFLKLKKNGFFSETASYKTKNGIWYYGTAKKDYVDKTVTFLSPLGLEQVKKNGIDIKSVYLKCNIDVLKKRLVIRGDNEEEAERRIRHDNEDFLNIEDKVDYIVYNDMNYSAYEVAEVIYGLVK